MLLSIKQFDSFVTNRSFPSHAFLPNSKMFWIFFTLFSFKIIAIEIVWKLFPGDFFLFRLHNNTIFPIELAEFVSWSFIEREEKKEIPTFQNFQLFRFIWRTVVLAELWSRFLKCNELWVLSNKAYGGMFGNRALKRLRTLENLIL